MITYSVGGTYQLIPPSTFCVDVCVCTCTHMNHQTHG